MKLVKLQYREQKRKPRYKITEQSSIVSSVNVVIVESIVGRSSWIGLVINNQLTKGEKNHEI